MNYWEEKVQFWRNKTTDNPLYEKQKHELASDLIPIIKRDKIKRVIDVGGYKGILGAFIPNGVEYINLDIVNGVDVTKPWAGQKTTETLKPIKKTLIVTSLVLLCIPPEELANVLREARKYGQYFYFYEQATDPTLKDGQQINSEYGGKWNYDWARLFKPWGKIRITPSEVNPNWVRIERVSP